MKAKNIFILLLLIFFSLACFITCEDPVIGEWWGDEEKKVKIINGSVYIGMKVINPIENPEDFKWVIELGFSL